MRCPATCHDRLLRPGYDGGAKGRGVTRLIINHYANLPAAYHEYDPHAPHVAGLVSDLIERTAPALRVEHVGSTAIPGLDAKPVIDLMVGLKSMADASSCVEPLTNLGYSYWAEGAQPHHNLFVRFVDPKMSARTHNLHLVEAGGQYWKERLLFRDYLRKHPETAKEYAELKYLLSTRHRDDREAYTAAKADFVSEVVHRVRNAL